MSVPVRRHLSYANVTATLALVFAMSGGALAAHHYLISSTKQINPKVLKKLRGRTGSTGPTGKEGPPGSAIAPSKAFSSSSGWETLAWPATPETLQTVATLSLPAGNFMVLGKLIADGDDPNNVALARCVLFLGKAQIDTGFDGIALGKGGSSGNPPEADRHYMVLSGIGSLSSPGQAEIICKVDNTIGKYMNRTLTAIQVGSLG
jgi:hypothetical protein